MFLCPENLDLNRLFINYPPKIEPGREFQAAYAYLIIDILCRIHVEGREDRVTEDGYIKLCSSILQEQVPRYQSYLRYLKSLDVIESNYSYVAKSIANSNNPARCIGYRLTQKYRTSLKEIEFKDRISASLAKKQIQLSDREKKDYAHILKWHNCNLLIDKEAALEFNRSNYEVLKENTRKWKQKTIRHPMYGSVKTSEALDPYLSYQARDIVIKRFSRGEFRFSTSKGRRLYSTLSFLPKELRKFVTYDGWPLVELDCGNSQPYLLLALFNKEFWLNEHEYFNLRDIRQYSISYKYLQVLKDCYFSSSKYSTMLDKLDEIRYSKGFQRYKSDVINGDFYETFYENHHDSSGPDNLFIDPLFENKDDVKVGILRYFNAHYLWKSPIKKGFWMDYPEVHELLMALKKQDQDSELSTFSHAIESEIMLFRVAKRFSKQYPWCPIYSIHDCLVTWIEREADLRAIMKDEFTKCLGVPPKIKTKYW